MNKENYMYYISVNQRAIVELGLDVDFIDMAIFDYIKNFTHSQKCLRVNADDGIYYWVSHKNIMDNMPMLRIKTDRSVINRVNNLVNAGLLKKHPDCDKLGKALYAFGNMYDLYEGFQTPENNFMDPRKNFHGNINTNNNTPIQSKDCPSPKGTDTPDEEFERWYNLYGKKTEKQPAWRMWKRLTKEQKKEIFLKTPAYVASTPDIKYRMNPATYINPANKRWQDEVIGDKSQTTNHVWK